MSIAKDESQKAEIQRLQDRVAQLERRLAEQSHVDVTTEHESQLRLLLQQIPAVVWTTDNDLVFTSLSGAGLTGWNFKTDQLKGVSLVGFLKEHLQADETTHPTIVAHRCALAGKSVNFEHHWMGSVFQAYIEPLRDVDEQVIGTVGVALDVTTRHRAEESLRESEGRFQALAKVSPVGIFQSDVQGSCVYVNQRCSQIMGLPLENMRGDGWTQTLHPEDRQHVFDAWNDTVKHNRLFRMEYRFLRPDGVTTWVLGEALAEKDDNEAITGYVGTITDITERKQAEQSLQQARDELEQRVIQRTAELAQANERLRKERRLLKRLLELHERDRQLIAYEIHDGLVQDITAAMMFLETTFDQAAESEVGGLQESFDAPLKLLRGSVDEARRLINGLRPPVLEDEGLVAAIENLREETMAIRPLEIEFFHEVQFNRVAPALEMAIYRIIQEGLNNVWQHSQSSKARVELIQHQDRVSLSIQDWGIGFDPDQVKRKRYGLTGVRERARLLDGQSEIISVVGEGTTISVDLPLTDGLLPSDEQIVDKKNYEGE